jgi:Fe-S oxidoreductase
MKLRDHAYGMFPLFGRSPAAGDKEDADEEERREIFGNILTEEEIWSCTTCGACEEECPVFIEYIDKIIDMRRNLIETSNAPRAFNQVFMHLEKTGNPFGKPPSKRSAWASELEGMSVRVLKEGDETDILYYVDSYPSYDPRAQSVAAAVVRTLNLAGVEFGILGPKEKDSGHQVRRMGEEGLFQLLMEENMETLKGIKFKKIVTTDPHAYNTLRNDYSIKFQVLHYSMLMNSLMEQGLLKPKRDVEPGIYTYHDPCYLGRHNGIYDEPRRLLKSLPGLKLVEMERSRDRSFCCGGGDIILWHEISSEKERPAGIRINMARKAGAGVIVTSCPFCLMHFEDAIKTAGLEWELKVVDLAELVVSTL